MKRYLPVLFSLFILLGTSACDSGSDVENDEGVLSEKKQKSMMTAARNLMLQKELAKMAIENTETNNAKAYGQELMAWATTKQNELQELAQQYNVTLPDQMERRQMKHIKDVTEDEATNYKYDLELWDSIKDAQRDAAEDFEEAIKDYDKADVTAYSLWLRNTVKELRAHLTQAAKYDLELKNREGGIAKPILEDMNN
mgnify:FL=1